jgi:hypothetical protein
MKNFKLNQISNDMKNKLIILLFGFSLAFVSFIAFTPSEVRAQYCNIDGWCDTQSGEDVNNCADCYGIGGGGGSGGGGNGGGTTITTTTVNNPNTLSCSLKTKPKLGDLFDFVTCIIGTSILPLMLALAVAMFIWGVIQYVLGGDEEKAREKGKQFMLWGIIALTVMVSIWGLVGILTNTFNLNSGFFIPQLKQ